VTRTNTAFICVWLAASSAIAGDLGHSVKELGPTLDKLMERTPQDHRHPHLSQWTLYGQADTSVSLEQNRKGRVSGVTMQFYLGWDKKREEHFNQCLPIAKFLIATFMPKHAMSIAEIEKALREIEHTRNTKAFREPDRVMYFRYKMSLPEDDDGYRCFRIEIGGSDAKPSTDT
jgi:hypothetical protein